MSTAASKPHPARNLGQPHVRQSKNCEQTIKPQTVGLPERINDHDIVPAQQQMTQKGQQFGNFMAPSMLNISQFDQQNMTSPGVMPQFYPTAQSQQQMKFGRNMMGMQDMHQIMYIPTQQQQQWELPGVSSCEG